jgi:SAM-dependent methyltransferase
LRARGGAPLTATRVEPRAEPADATRPAMLCPACRTPLARRGSAFTCDPCSRRFPDVVGLPDLRLASDRYLDLDAERGKAARLASFEASTDVLGLARAYYAMTDDVDDRRRARFLGHIAGAERRGEALAALLPPGGRVLEVGCGTGGFLVAAASAGLEAVGSDIATRWLVVARRRLADRGLRVPLVGAQAERLPWPDASFDALVADSVLEHLDDPAAALAEWHRVVRPGGRLLVWSPNRLSIFTDPHVGLWGLGFLPRRALPGYVRRRRGIPWMVRPLSAGEVARLASQTGWREVRAVAAKVAESLGRSGRERRLVGLYGVARSWPPTRALLTTFGPLWQLDAVREATG